MLRGDMVHGRTDGLTGCYDVSPSVGSTAEGYYRGDAAENQTRSDLGADASIPVGSHLSPLPQMGLTLPASEQRGHRFVPVPPSPHVKAVSWIHRDRGLRACVCVFALEMRCR